MNLRIGKGAALALLILCCCGIKTAGAAKRNASLTVSITNLENRYGQLLVGLSSRGTVKMYGNMDEMDQVQQIKITSRRTETTFDDLEPGIYYIYVLHDENSNGTMDVNANGIALEGFGYSSTDESPCFAPDPIDVKEGPNQITIQMTYMNDIPRRRDQPKK